jgi:pimeloyl-ACP methyl ester carboxylesterase
MCFTARPEPRRLSHSLAPRIFPISSLQYRELIPGLAGRYRVIAPDLQGFGFTEVPAERSYKYTFNALAVMIFAFTEALKLKRYAMYVFD